MSPLRQNRNEQHNQTETVFSTDDWIVKSGCHFSCINQSMGIQIISSKIDKSTNIQLCNAELFVSFTQILIILFASDLSETCHSNSFSLHFKHRLVIKSRQHTNLQRVYVENIKEKCVAYLEMECK